MRFLRFDEASEDEYNIQDHTGYGHMTRGIPAIKSTSLSGHTTVRAHLLHGHGIQNIPSRSKAIAVQDMIPKFTAISFQDTCSRFK